MTLPCIKDGVSILCFKDDLLASIIFGLTLILCRESYRILNRSLDLKFSKVEFLVSGFYENNDSIALSVQGCKLMFLSTSI